ncbi:MULTISPECIES: glutaminase [Microbacterium]|uniref:glutaminase n=1 Tax=Microbacterium TaxID=33882 RepID=UPI00217D8B0F|nr:MULTISPECIES: glutaminase [Microbacterium]UWF77244.1 glutaminase [Microbacterium neungamense]WCM55399.1 glutaminase [Microbacterium sp. EF45047]
MEASEAVTASALFDDARRRLADAGAPRVALGRERRSRWRGERIVRAGEAWHLGVLLLTADAVLATGEILRAGDPGRRGYAAESSRARAERRMQALRGGFAEGEIVHLGWTAVDLGAVDAGGESGPLRSVDGIPQVRWAPGGAFVPLAGYLDERIALLGRADGA